MEGEAVKQTDGTCQRQLQGKRKPMQGHADTASPSTYDTRDRVWDMGHDSKNVGTMGSVHDN